MDVILTQRARFIPHDGVAITEPLKPRITIARIQAAVALHYDIAQTEMVSARRSRVVARPRQIAMYISKCLTPKSLPDIGRRFGNRDHTTVIHAIKRVESLYHTDGEIADDIDALLEVLG